MTIPTNPPIPVKPRSSTIAGSRTAHSLEGNFSCNVESTGSNGWEIFSTVQSKPCRDPYQNQGPHSVIHKHHRCCDEHYPTEGFVTDTLYFVFRLAGFDTNAEDEPTILVCRRVQVDKSPSTTSRPRITINKWKQMPSRLWRI